MIQDLILIHYLNMELSLDLIDFKPHCFFLLILIHHLTVVFSLDLIECEPQFLVTNQIDDLVILFILILNLIHYLIKVLSLDPKI